MPNQNKYQALVLNGLACSIYGYMAYYLKREQFIFFISLISILFAIYYFQLKLKCYNSWSIWLPRVLLIFSVPTLSDDFYRYMLDGQLITQFTNPYTQLPSFSFPFYNQLNSPHYYSIYPPFAQFIFGICSYISQNKIIIFLISFKTILCIADYFTLKNIQKLKITNAYLYFLNPLIIIEFSGNMHLESLAICFISFYLVFKNKENIILSALFISLAILTKLLPALLLYPIILKIKHKKNFTLIIYVCFICLFAYLPFLINLKQNLFHSLHLYFNHFEFNASLYYFFRTIVQLFTSYNPIYFLGPLCGILFLIYLIFIFTQFSKHYFILIFLTFLGFFLLSTTVHPWYISTLIFLNLFAKTKSIFVWSFLIFLSYFTYTKIPFSENYLLITIEYILVIFTFCMYDQKHISNQMFHN